MTIEEAKKIAKEAISEFYQLLPPQSATPFDISIISRECAMLMYKSRIEDLGKDYENSKHLAVRGDVGYQQICFYINDKINYYKQILAELEAL